MGASYVEVAAKVIGVTAGQVRAYVERLKRLGGPESIPSVARYATIKAGTVPEIEQGAVIQEGAPLEDAAPEAPNLRELDNLYAKWAAATSPDERAAVVKEIYRPAHELGTAAGWQELHENDPDFPSDVAAAIVNKIPNFWEGTTPSSVPTHTPSRRRWLPNGSESEVATRKDSTCTQITMWN